MTLVTGTVQDLGYDGMEGTLWARPARFRSDGQVVYAPERKPYRVVDGVVSADLAPGPAVLELQVGSHARDTFEVVIPEADTTLADLLDTVFAWEPAQVSLFVAEREAAELAKTEAEAAAGQAVTAAQQTGQDRAHVDSIRETLDEAAQNNVAPYLTQTALNATYGTKAAVDAKVDSAALPGMLSTQVPPLVDAAIADGSTVADAAAQAVQAAAQNNTNLRWQRAAISDTVDTRIGSANVGVYPVGSSTAGLPVATPGLVQVVFDSWAGRTLQTFTPSSPTDLGRFTRTHSGGAWTEWRPDGWRGRRITTGSVNTYRTPGQYAVSSGTGVAGLPVASVGSLEVLAATSDLNQVIQRFTEWRSGASWVRRSLDASTWEPWASTWPPPPSPPPTEPARNALTYTPTMSSKSPADTMFCQSQDRMVGWNNWTSTLKRTFDNGRTWEPVNVFAGQSMELVQPLADGELLVSTTDGSSRRRVYRSQGLAVDPLTAQWAVVIDGLAPMVKFSPGWSVSTHHNIVLLNEYGPKTGMEWGGTTVAEGENARYTYLSLDYGQTWDVIFDLNTWLIDRGRASSDIQHLHGIAWDKYWDRIWLTFGDNYGGTGSNGVLYSDDLGKTWHAAHFYSNSANTWQVVGIIPMPDCILFGGDVQPSGVMRVDRAGGKHRASWEFTTAYDHPSGTHLCQAIRVVDLADGSVVALLGFGSEGSTTPSFLLGTRDGDEFTVLWEDTQPQPAGLGLRGIAGPTLEGELVLTHNDGRVSGQWSELRGLVDLY